MAANRGLLGAALRAKGMSHSAEPERRIANAQPLANMARARRGTAQERQAAQQQAKNYRRFGGSFGPFPAPGGSRGLVKR